MASSSSSSSSRNWSYHVFPSFSGEDVRKTFLSHFLKELDRKLIIAFKDSEIERSRSLNPELRKAIKDSRIAVVVFSKNYASSSWCLNELLEIVKCKEECGQMVIPVFYGLDPSHVRYQTGDFGKIFDKTCQNKTAKKINRWRRALTDVANILGYHSVTWANEATMINEIANDVLGKLSLNPSDDFEDNVGIEDHIRAMSSLLHLESEEVRMVGIWGASGIGKTTIARCLYSRLSRQFQSRIFIDEDFISKSMEVHSRANLVDYNMKLHLKRTFLAEILDKKDIKIDHLGAMENMLKHRKALIIIDDPDDQDVLDALAGRTQWFGSGSRIIVITKDMQFLRAHGIDDIDIYEVSLPSKNLALEMFCRSAFRKNSPPDGFTELASEVVLRAGNLPLGLNFLGSSLRGRDKEDWIDMLPRLRNGLDEKIERTLRVSYDTLNNKKDKAIFRHIACLFNRHQMVNDVLDKLLLTPSKDSENFVGIEDHIAQMSVLLQLESQEVRMVGLWCSSGVGKTTISRALFNRLSRNYRGSIFIDRAFVSKSTGNYSRANPDVYNMMLHLQVNILPKILRKNDIQTDRLGAVGEMLKKQKILICVDDLDDQMVLDALVGQTQWFGSGSRIIVVANDKHFLKAHGINYIYKVSLPSEDLALEMLGQSAFRRNSPPTELAYEVILRAGNLPLGLEVLGSNLPGREKEDWRNMLQRLRNGLDGKIERTLRVSNDGLNNKKDETIFRQVACLFNFQRVDDIKLLLADSNLDVNIGLKNLIDKSLIRYNKRWDMVVMHSLLEEIGKEIVRSQSNEPGEREFLTDWEEICDVLENNTGTKNVLGIALDVDGISEVHVHKNAFKAMRNLRFLEVDSKRLRFSMPRIPCKLQLPKSFDYLPPKLKYLFWYGYPMTCMPSKFRPENLVKLIMPQSNLEKLWEGVVSLTCLKEIYLAKSRNLKEIPDLSKATNLETLNLESCSSLLELPSSIRNLKKLRNLYMYSCTNLKTIPSGIYLNSLDDLDLRGCSGLRSVSEILTNISEQLLTQTTIEKSPAKMWLEELDMTNLKSEKLWEGVQQPLTPLLTKLWLSYIPSLVELPSSFQNLNKLTLLQIKYCKKLETLPTGINLQSLEYLDLTGCSRLRTFPNISTNISELILEETAIEEVPWWIENFSCLSELNMDGCNNLQRVSLNILKLKHLREGDFSNCGALTEASWDDCLDGVAMTTNNNHSRLPDEASSYLPDNYFSMVRLSFIGCFNFDPKVLLQQQTFLMKVTLSGEEMPSYFTHRTNGTTLTNIPLPHISPSQPFLIFKACALCDVKYICGGSFEIKVCFRFIDISENHFDYVIHVDLPRKFSRMWGSHLVIFDCYIPLNKDSTPLTDQINYDHVDIQFRLIGEDSQLQLKGCGIQLLENGQSLGNRPCTPNVLPNVCGGNTTNNAYLRGHETEHNQECGDSAVESNPDTLPHVCEADEDNVVKEETEQSVEFVGSDEETVRISKRMRIT